MITKATRGAKFKGLVSYLTGKPDAVVLGERNLSTIDPEEAAWLLQASAEASAHVQKPVYHVSIRQSPGDRRLTVDEWLAAAEDMAEGLGLHNHQALIVRHGQDHIHIAFNRVDSNGRTAKLSHDYRRRSEIARELEQRFGLQTVANPFEKGGRNGAPTLTSGERKEYERTGMPPMTARIKMATAEAWRAADSAAAVQSALADKGLVLARGERRGFIVVDVGSGRAASLSRVVKGAKARETRLASLDPNLLPTQETAGEWLKAYRARQIGEEAQRHAVERPATAVRPTRPKPVEPKKPVAPQRAAPSQVLQGLSLQGKKSSRQIWHTLVNGEADAKKPGEKGPEMVEAIMGGFEEWILKFLREVLLLTERAAAEERRRRALDETQKRREELRRQQQLNRSNGVRAPSAGPVLRPLNGESGPARPAKIPEAKTNPAKSVDSQPRYGRRRERWTAARAKIALTADLRQARAQLTELEKLSYRAIRQAEAAARSKLPPTPQLAEHLGIRRSAHLDGRVAALEKACRNYANASALRRWLGRRAERERQAVLAIMRKRQEADRLVAIELTKRSEKCVVARHPPVVAARGHHQALRADLAVVREELKVRDRRDRRWDPDQLPPMPPVRASPLGRPTDTSVTRIELRTIGEVPRPLQQDGPDMVGHRHGYPTRADQLTWNANEVDVPLRDQR